MTNSAFDRFRVERQMAIDKGASSFVYSGNGVTYRRVQDGGPLVKFVRSGGQAYRGAKRSKRSKRRSKRRSNKGKKKRSRR